MQMRLYDLDLKKTDFWLLASVFLLGLSLFTSKSGLTAFFMTSLALCVAVSDYRKIWIKDKTALALSSLFILAMLFGLISDAGLNATWSTFRMWPYALTAIIAAVIYEKKMTSVLKWGFYLGLILGGLKSLSLLLTHGDHTDFQHFRLASFWDIGRWGTFTAMFCIGLFPHIIFKRTYDKYFFFKVFLFLFSFVLLFLSNTRAPLLACLICLGIMALLSRKGFLAFLTVIVAMGLFTLNYPNYYDRFISSFSIGQNTDGQLVSKNMSNAGRLNMWKVSLDYWQSKPFTPSGFDHYKPALKTFLETKDADYLKKYTEVEFSFNDNHSTYLFFLVQVGLLFSLILWSVVVYIICKNTTKLWNSINQRPLFYSAFFIVIAHLILGLFYSSLVSFEAITFFPALYLINRID